MECATLATLVAALAAIHSEAIDSTTTLLYVGDRNQPRAVLLYRRMEDGTLSVDAARTDAAIKRQGYNRELFAEMLRRNPDATEIESTLMEENFATYKRAEEEEPNAPCAALVMRTPAARVRASFGFTRVLECMRGAHSVILRMSR